MAHGKYIAAGFLTDSENLIKEFVQANSTNFTDFATKWKEHNFSLIYSGRDKDELLPFTNEIFQLTLGYLQNGSIILQVGAVYLLYSLYRNQLSKPPVQIRITLPQWQILRRLKGLSEKNHYLHLHYIISFLYKNAFEFVANNVLFGPCSSRGKMDVEKTPMHASFMLKDCKNEMISFRNSNLLQEIKDLSNDYASLGKKFLPLIDTDRGAHGSTTFGEYVDCLESLVNDGTYKGRKVPKKTADVPLGDRRAKLKANQFSRKALFRQLNPSDSDEDYEPVEEEKAKRVKRCPRKKRTPKEKRKVGRPKKFDLDKLLESDYESDQGPKTGVYKRRGPIQRGSYLQKYELKVPEFNKKIFKDFMQDCSSDTSEGESPACKETSNNTHDNPDNLEEQHCIDDTIDLDSNEPEEIYSIL